MRPPWLALKRRQPRSPRAPHTKHRPEIERLEDRCLLSADAVMDWNAYMLQAEANDFDPLYTADQPGPVRTARAFAIVQAAVYDAVNSIDGSYTPYLSDIPNAQGASIEAAVAQAAHDTLAAMFPRQQSTFDNELHEYLEHIPPGEARERGIEVGRETAANMLAARENDGSQMPESYVPIPLPGYHQVDPLHPNQGFLNPQWGEVRPFVLGSSNQFRSADVGRDPQARLAFLNSDYYTAAFNEVRLLGAKDSTVRTPDQTQIGIFWGYDGVPQLGTPPRLYNQITETIATLEGNTEVQNARLFALVNLAMGDAGIACWESKYFYNFWRPIVGIRNADSTGNPNTPQDPNWEPLGAQADNGALIGSDFTPPFPSYDSGHATFGAALFETLRDFYGTDDIPFSFQSDEYNGVTMDSMGNVRPQVTRPYNNLTQAENENRNSRIYLGVHWRFDQEQGDIMGRQIADYVISHIMEPEQPGAGVSLVALATAAMSAVNGGATTDGAVLSVAPTASLSGSPAPTAAATPAPSASSETPPEVGSSQPLSVASLDAAPTSPALLQGPLDPTLTA